jgi:uncharacterized protein YjbI with pentapeptide repeats
VTRYLSDSGLAVSGEASPRLLSDIALSHTTLSDAHQSNADLSGATLSDANLREAGLNGTTLIDANLCGIDLSGANLSASLFEADLSRTFLNRADLSKALMGGAYLDGAEGITNEELEQQAASLGGGTMPNGQKYKDWLKSREENSGLSLQGRAGRMIYAARATRLPPNGFRDAH